MKKKSLKQKLFLILIALSSTALSQDNIKGQEVSKSQQHVASMGIDHTYFTYRTIGGVEYRQMALVMDTSFQPCPNAITPQPDTVWAAVREEDIGEKRFEMLSSVILAALLADKTVSLIVADDECYGTRAKVLSVRINK